MNEVSPTRFPPSFDGNPWTYGWALFSLTLVSAISLAILVGWALEARHQREIDRRLDNWVSATRVPQLTVYQLHRLTKIGFLITILLGAMPDAVLLYAWGEATDATIIVLFAVDRYCDGILLVPFLWTTFLILWGGQAVDHRLAADPGLLNVKPSWRFVRDNLKIVGVVLLIAVGVTYSKAVA